MGGDNMKKTTAIAATTALICTMVGAEHTSAAAAMTIKSGKLVYKWTGKIVKGYKVYHQKLYKNGVLTKGRVKYGKGSNMKLYRNGVLEKGIVVTKDQKYIFKNGALIKGIYTYEVKPGQALIFKNGVRTNRLEVRNNQLYDNGKLKKGTYVINAYEYDEGEPIDHYPMLFVDGKLSTNTMFATYKGQSYLFKDGVLATTYYKGKVYDQGRVAPANKFISIYTDDEETLYYNGVPYTGTYTKEDGTAWHYENGKMQMTTTLQQYLKLLDGVLASKNADQFDQTIQPLLAIFDENPTAIRRSSEQGSDEQTDGAKRVVTQLKQVEALAATFEKTAIVDGIETRIQHLYAELNRVYENGALRDGIYNGIVYRDGEKISSVTLQQLDDAIMAYYNEKDFDEAVNAKDVEKIKAALPTHLALLTAEIEARNDVLQDDLAKDADIYSYYESTAKEALQNAMTDRQKIIDAMTEYRIDADLTALHAALQQAYRIILNENINFEQLSAGDTFNQLAVDQAVTGTFDDKGFAYFETDLDAVEGNYRFTTKDTNLYSTWLSDNKADLTQREFLPTTVHHLMQGHHYIALKGEANQPFNVTLTKRSYNYETMTTLLPSKNEFDQTNRVKLPYYTTLKPTVQLTLNENKHVLLTALASNGVPVQKMTLTNNETGVVYEAKKLTDLFFSVNAPDGTYTLAIEAPENGGSGHVGINYMLSPHLELNKEMKSRDTEYDTFTLNVPEETTYQFYIADENGLTTRQLEFRLYDDMHRLVKKVAIPSGQSEKTFTYTIPKGQYSIKAKKLNITATIAQ